MNGKDIKKRVIKSSIHLHDTRQVETIFDYNLPNHTDAQDSPKHQKYSVDVYLIIPPQMGITSRSYSINSFYSDMRPMIRFKEPRFSFEDLMGNNNALSPLRAIRNFIDHTDPNTPQEDLKQNTKSLIKDIKYFSCAYVSFVEKIGRRQNRMLHSAFQQQNLLDQDFLKKMLNEVHLYLQKSYRLLSEFNRMRRNLKRKFPQSESLNKEMVYAEEYCAYGFKSALAHILDTAFVQTNKKNTKKIESFQKKLQVWVRLSIRFFKKNHYPWLTRDSTQDEKENFVIHYRSLKRRMSQVLYLNVKPEAIFMVHKQIGYMLAAGFAGLWAIIANILIIQKLTSNQHAASVLSVQQPTTLDSILGVGGMLLTFSGVVAYILKDRIKEIGRARFSRGVFGQLPDNREMIFYEGREDRKQVIGVLEETASFLKSYSHMPDPVIHLHQKNFGSELTKDHEVIHYRKHITLELKELSSLKYPIHAVRDIVRLNIGRFLRGLDDPEQYHQQLTLEGFVERISLPKIYNIDMILQYSYQRPDGSYEKIAIDARRLIVDKHGLIRIKE